MKNKKFYNQLAQIKNVQAQSKSIKSTTDINKSNFVFINNNPFLINNNSIFLKKNNIKSLNNLLTFENILNKKDKFDENSVQYLFQRLKHLISFFIKKGKKHLIENSLRDAFIKIGVVTNLTKLEILKLAFKNITPTIDLLRRGSFSRFKEKTFVPVLSLDNKNSAKSSHWFVDGVSSTKSAKSLSDKIVLELLQSAKKEGFSFEKLKEFYNLAWEQQGKRIFYKKKIIKISSPKKQGFNSKKKGFVKKKLGKSKVFFSKNKKKDVIKKL
jgi:ribosomal protein S7